MVGVKNLMVFFFKQKTAYEVMPSLVGSEMCIRDRSETLFEQGALPYYLHMPDPVTGTAHFMVSDAEAQPLYEAMRERLPGYLLPQLVREEPGEVSKTALAFNN